MVSEFYHPLLWVMLKIEEIKLLQLKGMVNKGLLHRARI